MQTTEKPSARPTRSPVHEQSGSWIVNRTVHGGVCETPGITATLFLDSKMEGELLAITGPRLCERFPLGAEDTSIGRSPDSTIHLDEPGIAWRHCVVQPVGNRYRILDQRSGTGTFLNGKRIVEHELEPGDQVSIGETVLLYREEPAGQASGTARQTLLRTCAMQFLFRALARSENAAVRAVVEEQLMRLIADMAPVIEGGVFLGNEAELRDARSMQTNAGHATSGLATAGLAERVCREGPIADMDLGHVAVPLYVRGRIAGVIAARFSLSESERLSEHADTFAAIATLGAMALETAREVERLTTENELLTDRLNRTSPSTGIVGNSPPMQRLMQKVKRVATSEASVLLLGETGTGKEMVAQAIHRASGRAGRAFVAINCAAITETLLESELFGHEKGAFTGA